jgi:hypothetical protein
MPGPLPKPDKRRRNAPTVPTTRLPAAGRAEGAPKCPYRLGGAGRAWWRWAWRLPQAAAWDDGGLYGLARRAQLEDEMASLEAVDGAGLAEVLGLVDGEEAAEQLRWLLGELKRRAAGSTALMREMRELDNRFGLNAKAMADLRWTIVDEEPAEKVSPLGGAVRALRVVDPRAEAS